MLRGLLREGAAAKALFENLGLFNDPERLEKYVVASEVTVEVLNMFFARILGTEKAPIESVDVSAVRDHLSDLFLNGEKDQAQETLSERGDDQNSAMEKMQGKVADLERQLAAMQRQLKMQGEVSELAVAVNDRLDKIVSKSEKQTTEIRDVNLQMVHHVELLKKEISSKAGVGDVEALSKQVSALREAERRLDGQIASVEEKIKEANQALRKEIQDKVKQRSQQITITPTNGPLNGIIAYLTQKYGGNVHDKGVVEVTGTSARGSDVHKNVVDLGAGSYFYSEQENEPNQWICYDFKDKRVAPTSYSIKSVNSAYNIKSWVFEVSNDGRDGTWQGVDSRNDNNDLKARSVTHNFPISQTHGSFRFVRLRQTGKNHGGDDRLPLCALEVFGTLYGS